MPKTHQEQIFFLTSFLKRYYELIIILIYNMINVNDKSSPPIIWREKKYRFLDSLFNLDG